MTGVLHLFNQTPINWNRSLTCVWHFVIWEHPLMEGPWFLVTTNPLSILPPFLIRKCTSVGLHCPTIEWDGQLQLAPSMFITSQAKGMLQTCWVNIGAYLLFWKWWSRSCSGMRMMIKSLWSNRRKSTRMKWLTRRHQAMAPMLMWRLACGRMGIATNHILIEGSERWAILPVIWPKSRWQFPSFWHELVRNPACVTSWKPFCDLLWSCALSSMLRSIPLGSPGANNEQRWQSWWLWRKEAAIWIFWRRFVVCGSTSSGSKLSKTSS